jgi:hypothetical protein
VVDPADLGQQLGLLLRAAGDHQAAHRVDHGLPVALLLLEIDHRLERVAVARIDLERLLEHVERLLALAERLANHAEPVVDADDVALVLAVAVLDQDRLVDLPGVLVVRHLEQQVGAADQRRQVRRVDVVGGLVVAERLLEVAELVGGARGAVVQLVELARIGVELTDLARQHVDHRR